MQKNNLCFCGSNQNYSDCCLPFINQEKLPLTAEALMRSRYSAFNVANVDYLIDTLLPEKRQHDDRQKIQNTIDNTHWLGLKIISTRELEKNNVEFIAFFQEKNNSIGQLHEKSNFIQCDKKWFYTDGLHLPEIKLKRNELCFCGSGKKTKKCHLS
jgi:SEC-C motif domain protein